MFKRLTHHFTQQATSFALAAMVTLSMLGGVDQLASGEQDAVAQSERVDPSAQQVVIVTAKRLNHS